MNEDIFRKITIGVWLEEDWNPEEGGGYTFNNAFVNAIDRYEFSGANFVFLTTSTKRWNLSKPIIRLAIDMHQEAVSPDRPSTRLYRKLVDLFKPLVPRSVLSIFRRFTRRPPPPLPQTRPWRDRVEEALTGLIRSRAVDVFYFPVWWRVPNNIDLDSSSVPYVTSYWDLGHVSTYAFPEFSHGNIWNWRETAVRKIFGKALLVFCESHAGLKEVSAYLGIYGSRFTVVPLFIPRPAEECPDVSKAAVVLSQLGLEPKKYFFYPAQFWSHKNHFGLLRAFREVLKVGCNVKLVLVGSDKGNLEYIKSTASMNGLDGSVVFAGFVDDSTITTLYRNALSLVMPSFLGPTNLPLLEAMEHGCPVICSDFDGHREMLGQAGIYVDPANHIALAQAMISLINDRSRQEAKASIESHREKHTFTADQAMRALDAASSRLQGIRSCWE